MFYYFDSDSMEDHLSDRRSSGGEETGAMM